MYSITFIYIYFHLQIYLIDLLDRAERFGYWIGLNDITRSGDWVWDAEDDPGFIWSGGTVAQGGVPSPINAY